MPSEKYESHEYDTDDERDGCAYLILAMFIVAVLGVVAVVLPLLIGLWRWALG